MSPAERGERVGLARAWRLGPTAARLVFLLAVLALWVKHAGALRLPVSVAGTDVGVTASGYVEGAGVIDTGGGRNQAPNAVATIRTDVLVQRWTGHAEVRGMVGGPYRDGEANLFNLRHAFQNASPSLDFAEAYIGYRTPSLELRGGIQRFALGKLDGVPPTDVVNARDFHDPLLRDFEEAKLGTPALSVSHFPGDLDSAGWSQLRLDAAYLPLAVPPRLPLVRERWFPPSTSMPALPGMLPLELSTENDAPPMTFATGGIFVRALGTWHEVDWEIAHYTGPETAPNGRLSAEVEGTIMDPCTPARVQATLRQTHATMHMTGITAATTFGGATIRAEGALFQNRHYLRAAGNLVGEVFADAETLAAVQADLCTKGRASVPLSDLFVAANSIEWGAGIDYYIAGFLPLLQINQVIPLDATPDLLIGDPDTRLTGVLRKPFWHDRFELDVRSTYAFEASSWFILPRLAYNVSDSLRVRIGYLAVGGSRNTLIGQYKNNDEVVADARFSF